MGTRRLGLAAGLATAGLAALRAVRQSRAADLRGRVALVTGGSRGLGFLLARELARQGCRLVICARDRQELERAGAELRSAGAEVLTIPCDVGDRAQVTAMVEEAVRRLGPVDVLVNNAGIIQVGPLEALTLQDFEDAMRAMFWGVVYPTLEVLPDMLKRRAGRIVTIASIGGKISPPHLLPYNCAKFAAVGFSEGLRAELAGRGVSVTTIAPGLMRTGSHLNALFTGNQAREYTWFALGATLPGISMDAERAARQIVDAARRGDAEKILSFPAAAAARFHGLFPGATADLMGLAARFVLPGPGAGPTGLERGGKIDEQLQSRLLDLATGLGRSAARRFNELSGQADAPS